ncbi:MAG TPA: hypothetical protein VGU63_16275, partial [Candidatus Acidoferrales bacterium]|nr:hypothetical protein [Candidatus Acidoferrales bacterium]
MNFRRMCFLFMSVLVVVSLSPVTHDLAVSSGQAKMLLADGGHPMPPPPPIGPASALSQSPILTADGGHPMPPPPPIGPA